MRPHSTPPQPSLARALIVILAATMALLVSWQSAMADGSSVSGSESPAVVTISATATPKADKSLIEQLPGEEDTALVVGVAAVTVIGLTGLAILDRRPDVVDHNV